MQHHDEVAPGVGGGALSNGGNLPAEGPTVLVVDDDEALRRVHARILSRHGFRVEVAEDAEAALRAIHGATFDLVITDITLPRMSGVELVDHLLASNLDIPVVVITGNPEIHTAIRAVEQGVTRYLIKPIERGALVDVASDAIRLHGIKRAKRLALDNECLKELIHELNRARVAEQAAGRVKRDFLSQMSHELRTPLAQIIGFTELALDTALSSTQREYLETSRHSANTLLGLIENILDFSNLDAGNCAVTSDTMDLRAVVAETMAPLIELAERKGLSISLNLPPNVPAVLVGDVRKFQQVIEHVVGNATKFTRGGGKIAVKVEVFSSAKGTVVVRVCVADSGIGIPKAAQEKIFSSFSQADNSPTREHGGVGLGLTISVLLVNLMGGAIDLASTPGVGTTVTFTARFAVPEPSDTSRTPK